MVENKRNDQSNNKEERPGFTVSNNPIVSKTETGVETVADNAIYGTKLLEIDQVVSRDPYFVSDNLSFQRIESREGALDPLAHLSGNEAESDPDQLDFVEAKNVLANLGIPRHSGTQYRSTTKENTPTQRVDYDSFYIMDTTAEEDQEEEIAVPQRSFNVSVNNSISHSEPLEMSEAQRNDPFH